MKAIVLSCDRNRALAAHTLMTYQKLWPDHPFTFRVPYQHDRSFPSGLGEIEPIRTPLPIRETVLRLLDDLPDEEWVLWCIDDKFLIEINAEVASHLVSWARNHADPTVTGLLFCRCRGMCGPPHVTRTAVASTSRGVRLLKRFDFNQIWLHQLLRVGVLRDLFAGFPDRHFRAIEMDTFTQQGANAKKLPPQQTIYVTQQNFLVLGESLRNGRLTQTCIDSLSRHGCDVPAGFDTIPDEVRMGGCAHLSTGNSICLEFR